MSKNVISRLNAVNASAKPNLKLAEQMLKPEMSNSVNPKKSILNDLFGRKHTYLRVSLTERCNLRCILHFLNFILYQVNV